MPIKNCEAILSSPSSKSGDEAFALHVAVYSNSLDVVRYLLETHGVHPNTKLPSEACYTLLIAAIRCNSFGVIGYLVKNGADANEQSGEWRTPLHALIDVHEVRSQETDYYVYVLLEAGADEDIKDKNEQSPLDLLRTIWELRQLSEVRKTWSGAQECSTRGARAKEQDGAYK
jgi:ankyrin repeat protein